MSHEALLSITLIELGEEGEDDIDIRALPHLVELAFRAASTEGIAYADRKFINTCISLHETPMGYVYSIAGQFNGLTEDEAFSAAQALSAACQCEAYVLYADRNCDGTPLCKCYRFGEEAEETKP